MANVSPEVRAASASMIELRRDFHRHPDAKLFLQEHAQASSSQSMRNAASGKLIRYGFGFDGPVEDRGLDSDATVRSSARSESSGLERKPIDLPAHPRSTLATVQALLRRLRLPPLYACAPLGASVGPESTLSSCRWVVGVRCHKPQCSLLMPCQVSCSIVAGPYLIFRATTLLVFQGHPLVSLGLGQPSYRTTLQF